MVLMTFSDPATWAGGHHARVKSNLVMAIHLVAGLMKSLIPARRSRRRTPRTTTMRRTTIGTGTTQRRALVRDHSARGIGLIVMGRPLPADQCWTVTSPDGSIASYTVRYRTRLAPFVWRYGACPSALAVETPPQLAATATGQA
jgi:hypothetical protein